MVEDVIEWTEEEFRKEWDKYYNSAISSSFSEFYYSNFQEALNAAKNGNMMWKAKILKIIEKPKEYENNLRPPRNLDDIS